MVGFSKKHTGMPILDYDAAVEEALCYGWIDSIVKKLDDDRYARKVSPRRPDSRWSALNRKRVKKLLKLGLMSEPGREKIAQAKKSGHWYQSDCPKIPTQIPMELKNALKKNRQAERFFNQLAPSYQKQFIGWIAVAKRRETKDRRVSESIDLLQRGKKLGLK
jgi:uncharacterized protein YdeI (YjbR/CyaY-like superfamily)